MVQSGVEWWMVVIEGPKLGVGDEPKVGTMRGSRIWGRISPNWGGSWGSSNRLSKGFPSFSLRLQVLVASSLATRYLGLAY